MDKIINLINEDLKKQLNIGTPPVIFDAMSYSVFSGGKRLRGLIMVGIFSELGGDIENIMPFASALEMIHAYSLIHDDLPSMDNDDLRRGKPTNHIVYGEAMAILAGDGLLNLAYETIFNNCKDSNTIEAGRVISNCAGVYGMIGGQVADIEGENRTITKEEIDFIHHNKTGKLFKAAFTVPAIIKGKDKEIIDKLEIIGYNYGKAFQISDDILDVESSSEVLGKPVGSDEKNNKSTYVSLFGLHKSKEIYKELKDSVLDDLSQIIDCNSQIFQLIEKSFQRKK